LLVLAKTGSSFVLFALPTYSGSPIANFSAAAWLADLKNIAARYAIAHRCLWRNFGLWRLAFDHFVLWGEGHSPDDLKTFLHAIVGASAAAVDLLEKGMGTGKSARLFRGDG
jgi:hypothetical protein